MLKGEGPFVKILRRLEEAKGEEVQLAEQLVEGLRTQPSGWDQTSTWFEVVQEWQNAETINAALRLCLEIVQERNPFTQRNVSRQLRRWRREQGLGEQGWLELRSVRGHGPYVYYRWRRPGERTIQTEYYGRADQVIEDLSLGLDIGRASHPSQDEHEETT